MKENPYLWKSLLPHFYSLTQWVSSTTSRQVYLFTYEGITSTSCQGARVSLKRMLGKLTTKIFRLVDLNSGFTKGDYSCRFTGIILCIHQMNGFFLLPRTGVIFQANKE